MNKDNGRFEVLLKDGEPYIRIDREDIEMVDYKPTAEDRSWAESIPRLAASS